MKIYPNVSSFLTGSPYTNEVCAFAHMYRISNFALYPWIPSFISDKLPRLDIVNFSQLERQMKMISDYYEMTMWKENETKLSLTDYVVYTYAKCVIDIELSKLQRIFGNESDLSRFNKVNIVYIASLSFQNIVLLNRRKVSPQ